MAASQPACPAPTTTTSKVSCKKMEAAKTDYPKGADAYSILAERKRLVVSYGSQVGSEAVRSRNLLEGTLSRIVRRILGPNSECGGTMELQDFLNALEQRIARYDLLCHPYYKAWTAGELTREDLRAYAADYYHHVAAFPTYLSTLHSRLDDCETRRAVLRNLCGEELEGRPHSELWLDFAEGMGGDREQVQDGEPVAEVAELIGEFRQVASEGSTAEVLAAFYAYESQVPRVAKSKADGLAQWYRTDARTRGYFELHQFADVEHADVWRQLLSTEVSAHPEQSISALDAAERAAQALWHALDGMEARRTATAPR